MSRIVHFVHQSLDGFIEGPNGEFDWPAIGPELSEYSRGLTDTTDAFLFGRVGWEGMSSFWPTADETSDDPFDVAFAPVWREKPKVVVSSTLASADWNTTVLAGPDELAKHKAESAQDLLMLGGSGLAATLTERGLIDEYQIFVHPVVLGGGKPVFLDPQRFDLRLVETRTFDGTVVLLRYQR